MWHSDMEMIFSVGIDECGNWFCRRRQMDLHAHLISNSSVLLSVAFYRNDNEEYQITR